MKKLKLYQSLLKREMRILNSRWVCFTSMAMKSSVIWCKRLNGIGNPRSKAMLMLKHASPFYIPQAGVCLTTKLRLSAGITLHWNKVVLMRHTA